MGADQPQEAGDAISPVLLRWHSCFWRTESSAVSLWAFIIENYKEGLMDHQVAYCQPCYSCHGNVCSGLGSWCVHWHFRGPVPQQLRLSLHFLPVVQKLFRPSSHIYIFLFFFLPMPLSKPGFPLYRKSHTVQAQLTKRGLFPKAAGHRQILGFVFIPGLMNTPCSPLGAPQGLLWSKKLWKRILITSFPQTEAPSCPCYSSHSCTHPNSLQQTYSSTSSRKMARIAVCLKLPTKGEDRSTKIF